MAQSPQQQPQSPGRKPGANGVSEPQAPDMALRQAVEQVRQMGAKAPLPYRPDPSKADLALRGAIARHGLPQILIALAAGADPDRPDDNGICPLSRAATRGEASFVQALLRVGADPNCSDFHDTMNPADLPISVSAGMPKDTGFECLETLLGAGAAPRMDPMGHTLLMHSARRGNTRCALLIARHMANDGALIDAVDAYGMSAAAYARKLSHPELALELETLGAAQAQALALAAELPEADQSTARASPLAPRRV